MLRTPASRAVLRSLSSASPRSQRPILHRVSPQVQWSSQLCTLSATRPQAVALAASKTVANTFARQLVTSRVNHADIKAEKELGKQKLEPHPELVSSTSSIHPISGEVGVKEPEKEPDMLAGMKGDLKTISETFNLDNVPQQAYVIGLAGVIPYLATSLATVACAYEIHNAGTGSSLLLSEHSAELLLHILEPLQVGYGAVIISFLGAIHWGLEWAGYGGTKGYPRYAIGVIAPALAWPTILLPVEYALIAQFLTFNFLYYADTRVARMGWTPPWYGTYRFVLTFFVGAAIVVSLIGRGQIADRIGKLPSPADRINEYRENAAAEELANAAAAETAKENEE
ncbi:hypothetical protein K402DRAFT_388386 [Aulographum hederae CBS 113979]|uniref:Uncharacterized protein n=1 Tax=Aulographum hederae CBS 113979 TaxID=1176131 RepID=A0A6G1HF89_9PEZI|nr:hypothetical protein K402DRAFT_388386 [Aulographum hederae CBS 113979]